MFNPPNIRIFNGINYFVKYVAKTSNFIPVLGDRSRCGAFLQRQGVHFGSRWGSCGRVDLRQIHSLPYSSDSDHHLQLLAVFTFNARVFQMRTAVLAAILMIALQAWIGVDYFTADKEWIFKFTAVFPLVAAILNFIAARYILRDQLLVESVSHLRSRKKNHKI